MYNVNVYKRLTHRYAMGWASLDNHEYLGAAKATPARMVRQPAEGEYSDGGTYVQFVRLPAGLSARQRREARQAIADTMTSSRCRHEFDCCGCISHYARAYPTRDARTVRVVTSVGYNY
jgi:hypothetical protein